MIFDKSTYITELCSGIKYMNKSTKKMKFKEAVFVDFEDTKMPIPIGAKGYLKEAFGDFMSLPPGKNLGLHIIVFTYMDLEKPYMQSFFDVSIQNKGDIN